MGSVRTCDARCHEATALRCACWCGGLFHGARGQAARDAFVAEYGSLPREDEDFKSATAQPALPLEWARKSDAGVVWRSRLERARATTTASGYLHAPMGVPPGKDSVR